MSSSKKPLGHRVSQEAHDRIARLAADRGISAGQVIEEALIALEDGKALSKAKVLAWIERNTKGK